MNIKIFILICTFFEVVASAPTLTEESSDLFERNMRLSPEQKNEIEESVNNDKTNKREDPSEDYEETDNGFEGDMILSPEQKNEIEASMIGISERKVILGEKYRWPNGVVIYDWGYGYYSDSAKQRVKEAMKLIQDRTCVRFVEYNAALGHTDRVEIQSKVKACYAYVGKQDNIVQYMNVGTWCSLGSTVHELLHTLGLYHEQSRTDRDDYLIIHLDNVKDGKERQFNKYGANHITDLGVPYDYESIMHYPGKAFSKNGQLTIETKDASMQDKIGQRVQMSPIDVQIINKLYNCPLAPSPGCTETGSTWEQISGGLKWVASGPAGVWGVNSNDNIYYRAGTYRAANTNPSTGSTWTQISGGLKQISVGKDIVWGVNSANSIYYRAGISESNPTGTEWVNVSGALKQISVSAESNDVWGVNSGDGIYRRTGITSSEPAGTGWKQISGALKDVSVDFAGVWGVNSNGNIYHRTGTFENPSAEGTGWEMTEGALKQISSGNGIVWGVNSNDKIYYRTGISSSNPSGEDWQIVSGGLKQVSISGTGCSLWGVNSSDQIYFRTGTNQA